jgi:hypothetical protein
MITTLLVCHTGCGRSFRSGAWAESSVMWAVEADRAGWRLVPQPRTGFAVWACPDHNGIPETQ